MPFVSRPFVSSTAHGKLMVEGGYPQEPGDPIEFSKIEVMELH